MKFLVYSKDTLKPPRFVKSFKSSCALLSKIPLMIGFTIGVERPCPIARMFFNKIVNSSFNFGLVSRIEKCFFCSSGSYPFFYNNLHM